MKNHINQKTGKPFPRGAKMTSAEDKAKAARFPLGKRAIPASNVILFPTSLNMLGNDQYGDCVTAEEGFNKQCGGINISYNTAVAWAQKNGVLNGANLQPVIQQMQSHGFDQDGNVYGDGAPLYVDYTNIGVLQAAVYQAVSSGGCIKMGIAADALPGGAGNQNGWVLTGITQPDSNQDHCMGISGYCTLAEFAAAMLAAFNVTVQMGNVPPSTMGFVWYTWSTIGWADNQSTVNMSSEAWIRNPNHVNSGTNPSAVDKVWTTVGPTPVPPGPNPPPTPPPTPPTPPNPPADTVGQVVLTGTDGRRTINLTGTVTTPVTQDPNAVPPWLLLLLTLGKQILCPLAPTLPAPWNVILGALCNPPTPPAP